MSLPDSQRTEADKRAERTRNLIFFKVYATHEEMGRTMPFMLVVGALILGAIYIWG